MTVFLFSIQIFEDLKLTVRLGAEDKLEEEMGKR